VKGGHDVSRTTPPEGSCSSCYATGQDPRLSCLPRRSLQLQRAVLSGIHDTLSVVRALAPAISGKRIQQSGNIMGWIKLEVIEWSILRTSAVRGEAWMAREEHVIVTLEWSADYCCRSAMDKCQVVWILTTRYLSLWYLAFVYRYKRRQNKVTFNVWLGKDLRLNDSSAHACTRPPQSALGAPGYDADTVYISIMSSSEFHSGDPFFRGGSFRVFLKSSGSD
jgi:hypothetical protein